MRRFADKGFLMIVAAILIVAGALIATTVTFLFVTRSQSGGYHLGSGQALFAAEAGLQRAIYEYNRGTACASLRYNATLTAGSYSTFGLLFTPATGSLTQAISPTDIYIPFSAAAAAIYASHGRIRIENEEINYTGVEPALNANCSNKTAPCFTGVRRGMLGTTVAAHATLLPLYQNQCLIRAEGMVASNNSARRILEANIPGYLAAGYSDSGSANITSATVSTQIGSLTNTNFPAGTNVVIGVATLKNTGAVGAIPVGDLRLSRGNTAVVLSNELAVRLGGGVAPSASAFPQKTQFLLYRDAAAAANQSYAAWARLNVAGNMSGEVKMALINNPPGSSFVDGTTAGITTVQATLLNHVTTLPAGNKTVLASIALANTASVARLIGGGNLVLRRSGVALTSNQFSTDLAPTGSANDTTGLLLMAYDPNTAANMSYSVTARATATGISGEARILVLHGLPGAFVNSGFGNLGATASTVAALNTSFPVGANIFVVMNQYDNDAAATVSVNPNNERLVFNGVNQAVNQYPWGVCTRATAVCDDYATGLVWRQSFSSSNVSVATVVQATATNLSGQSKILGIHINQPLIDLVEIFR